MEQVFSHFHTEMDICFQKIFGLLFLSNLLNACVIPLEIVACNLKSVSPKSSTLDKCRTPCLSQNILWFSAIGVYRYCAMLTRRAGVVKTGRITLSFTSSQSG